MDKTLGWLKGLGVHIAVLDEIGELPLSVQKAFLGVLQEKKSRPLGSVAGVSSNFRLIPGISKNRLCFLIKKYNLKSS
jgi:two-component system NtrC family response regulator